MGNEPLTILYNCDDLALTRYDEDDAELIMEAIFTTSLEASEFQTVHNSREMAIDLKGIGLLSEDIEEALSQVSGANVPTLDHETVIDVNHRLNNGHSIFYTCLDNQRFMVTVKD